LIAKGRMLCRQTLHGARSVLTCAPQHETSRHRSMIERRAALQPREGCARASSPVCPPVERPESPDRQPRTRGVSPTSKPRLADDRHECRPGQCAWPHERLCI
jgi:hypothetical protein